MKVFTPEISWHQKEPIFSVDFCNSTWKLASAGADFTIKIWQLKEDNKGNIGLDFMANLDRHSKPVNCVRFSPDGKFLASTGDDCIIIIWKLAEDEDDYMASEPSFGSEEIVNKEKWTVQKMLRRGHLEDIYDLAWSPDGTQLVSGSVDNSAIIWDINKGHFTNIIKDHKHYVQGVCWDPRGQYVVTHSSDRTCKVYSLSKNRCIHTIQKSTFPILNPTEDGPKQKSSKLFMDETMQSFFRRCRFSPDGLLLALPGGIYESGEKPIKATYVYTRGGFSKPALCLPGSKKASIGVCFCPIIFENMTHKENMADKENQSSNESMFKLPYRMCYAVATLDSVVFYDTQHPYPFGFVSNVHYASLTDMTWSSDGRIVVVSSLDGYCSIISFEDGELGKPSQIDPMEFVSNKLKAKREAKKEAKKIQMENKVNVTVSNEKEKEQALVARPSTVPPKDQPTLHQFVTPVRKRKRNLETGESPQMAPVKTPSSVTPNARSKSTGSSKLITGKGSPDCPIDLTGGQESVVMKSPQLAEQQKTSQASSATKSTKTPKRANLISLGFKPITKTPTNSADCVEQGNDAKPAEEPAQNSIQSKQGMPRRISFVTVTNASTGSTQTPSSIGHDSSATPHSAEGLKIATADCQRNDSTPRNLPATNSHDTNNEPIKAPRRVSFVSLSAKRDHTGILKEASNSGLASNDNVVKESDNKPEKTEAASTKPGSLNVQPGVPASKPVRRVEVISLLDNSPQKVLQPKIFTRVKGRDALKKQDNNDTTVSSSESGHLQDGSDNTRKDTAASQLGESLNPQHLLILQGEKDLKAPHPSTGSNSQGKSQSGSSPGTKTPRRVGYITLTSSK